MIYETNMGVNDNSGIVSEKDLAENYDNVEKKGIPKLMSMLKQLLSGKENKEYGGYAR